MDQNSTYNTAVVLFDNRCIVVHLHLQNALLITTLQYFVYSKEKLTLSIRCMLVAGRVTVC